MAQDWRAAFFAQARSDYDLMLFLNANAQPFCHQLHYLQMAAEKLAKGFLTAPGGQPPPQVHRAYVQFLQQIKRRPELQRVCDCGPRQISGYIDSLLPTARRIEDLAPSLANNGPNPEYPWPAAQGVLAPVEYPFGDLEFDARSMIKMLNLIGRCFEIV